MTIILLFGGTDTTVQDRNDRRGTGAGAALGPQLFAARYNVAGNVQKEVVYRPANVGIRWALPGGLQRMELTVRAKSREDARNRYSEGLGERWILMDANIDRPIADGWCYEIVPDGLHVHYIIGGAWKRHEDTRGASVATAATTTSAAISAIVVTTEFVNADDVTHIEETSTAVGEGYKSEIDTNPIIGSITLKELIENLLPMGNSSDQIIDYWLVPAPMSGIYPQRPYAYLSGRDNTDDISWQCRERDLSSLDLSRNIWDLQNTVYVYYTQTTTISSGGTDGSTSIVVASATNFAEGNEIEIVTNDGSKFNTTLATVAGTTFTLNDPLSKAAANGNVVGKKTIVSTAGSSDSSSVLSYWNRTSYHEKPDLNATQAAQYRDALLAQYANPAQLASFTIGSGFVRDGVGNRVPVWRMLINPGIIRINDLFADGETFTNSIDGRQSFRIVALDYDHSNRSMRVTPDTLNEARLDVLLQRAGIGGVGQMIDRS